MEICCNKRDMYQCTFSLKKTSVFSFLVIEMRFEPKSVAPSLQYSMRMLLVKYDIQTPMSTNNSIPDNHPNVTYLAI